MQKTYKNQVVQNISFIIIIDDTINVYTNKLTQKSKLNRLNVRATIQVVPMDDTTDQVEGYGNWACGMYDAVHIEGSRSCELCRRDVASWSCPCWDSASTLAIATRAQAPPLSDGISRNLAYYSISKRTIFPHFILYMQYGMILKSYMKLTEFKGVSYYINLFTKLDFSVNEGIHKKVTSLHHCTP